MSNARVNQLVRESLVEGTPHARIDGLFREAVMTFSPNARVNGLFREAIVEVNPNLTVSSTALVSSTNPSYFETSVTFTATITGVSPISPSGTVTFFDGLAALTTVDVSPASAGVSTATLSISYLSIGNHPILAVYHGDVNYYNSTSNSVSQQVNANPTIFLPSFALLASYSVNGDSSLTPQATLYAVPSSTSPGTSLILLWNTLNVAEIEITGNNGIDPPFNTGLIPTTGSGAYVVEQGFSNTINLLLTAYNSEGSPLGLTALTTITIAGASVAGWGDDWGLEWGE